MEGKVGSVENYGVHLFYEEVTLPLGLGVKSQDYLVHFLFTRGLRPRSCVESMGRTTEIGSPYGERIG